jgi:uncharacterized membrane protein YfhO
MSVEKGNALVQKGMKNHLRGNKIELLSCYLKKVKCTEHLNEINNNYENADLFRYEKDYSKSIRLLKNAYFKASELNKESTCTNCVSMFHQTIKHTLEDLNMELHNMTHGFFARKRFKPNYLESCHALNDIRFNKPSL